MTKSQTVLLDLCGCTMVRQEALRASISLRQFCLTYADALHFEIEKICGTRAPSAVCNNIPAFLSFCTKAGMCSFTASKCWLPQAELVQNCCAVTWFRAAIPAAFQRRGRMLSIVTYSMHKLCKLAARCEVWVLHNLWRPGGGCMLEPQFDTFATLQRNFTMRLLSATHFGQLNTPFFTHRRQTLLHTDAFTHRHFYTQKFLHTEAFTHRRFYTQKLLHRSFYTQTLLHTEAFTPRHFYTHRLLHADAFTHRHVYTKLLHTDAFTHRNFYTQKLLHTDTFTHGSFYAQTLLHT